FAVWEPLLDLALREAGPGADVDLTQARIRHDRHAVLLGDDLRRLVGALEVAGIHRVEGHPAKLRRECARLRTAGVVERRVGPTLPPSDPVPLGLAVSREEDRRHDGTVTTRWSSVLRTRCASSPARRGASASPSRSSCARRALAS